MPHRRPLTISFYPLIPDVAQDHCRSYLGRLKQEFESLHPDIDLRLQLGLEYNTSDPQYLEKIFSENLVDAAEVDSINLSVLTDHGWALPVTDQNYTSDPQIYPQALQALTMDGQLYAYPTALCSCFLFSRHPEILDVQNLTELLSLFEQKDPSLPKIFSNALGLSVTPIVYGLTYAGVHGRDNIQQSMVTKIDPQVLETFTSAWQDCARYLLHKHQLQSLAELKITDPLWPLTDYIAGKSHSFIGFSEDLNQILRTGDGQPVYSIPALFGDKHPVLFTNGLVTNTVGCTSQRQRDVAAFAQYYGSVKTMVWRSLAKDSSGPPRYLLSHRRDFFQHPEIKRDKNYANFQQVLEEGVIFPNRGYSSNRERITQAVYRELAKVI